MKVKELIEQLKKLDQEKNIWVIYDYYALQIPKFEALQEDDILADAKVGDYAHVAW